MPVRGLTPGMIEVGKIKIGMKGEMRKSGKGTDFRPPVKLDHFIITTNEKTDDDDLVRDNELEEKIKKLPGAKVNSDGNLIQIPIRLLYNDFDLNFPTRYARYSGGKCVCSSLDGVKARTRAGLELDCPCEYLMPTYAGTDKCKVNGTLSCIIEGAESFGGCHRFRTTSRNTCESILGSLAAIKTATGGMLAFLPFSLVIHPKQTVTPEGQRTTVYLVSVTYPGTIEDLQKIAMGVARDKAAYMLAMDDIEAEAKKMITAGGVDGDEKEIGLEFYPDTMVETTGEEVTETKKSDEQTDAEPEEPPFEIREDAEEGPADETTEDTAIKDKEASQVAEEPNAEPEKEEEDPAVIKAELVKVVKLKKELGITDKDAWNELIKPYDVESAKDMTLDQVRDFIKVLESKRPS